MHKYALVVIDMQRGFLDPSSPHIAGAADTVPARARAIDCCHRAGVPVVLPPCGTIGRTGPDVERARYDVWAKGGGSPCPRRARRPCVRRLVRVNSSGPRRTTSS